MKIRRNSETAIQIAPELEVIVCSVADALEAERGGAGRVEIIRDFQQGGLTPPMKLVREILDAVSLPVRVMLRESDGYEVTQQAGIERLCWMARKLSALPLDGVVLGFLRNGEIDLDLTKRVLSCAPTLKATFHHAFDQVKDPLEAIESLKTCGQIDRILTSGGDGDLAQKISRLASYAQAATPSITILAGGGLDATRIKAIREATDIREFHVGRAARVPASVQGVVQAARVKQLIAQMK